MTIGAEVQSHEKYVIEKVWDKTFQNGFNLLFTKRIFRDSDESLVFGCSNGDVKLHKAILDEEQTIIGFEKEGRSYETKGGPIHTLISSNVAKFASEDVLVGDTNGLFTIITNGQILKRTQLCDSKINAMVLDVDSAGNQSIVVGSNDGTIVACTPHNTLWKCRLVEVLKENERSSDQSLCITALHVYRTQNTTCDASYVMVADSQKRLHFFQNGTLVKTLHLPSVVTSMCSGYFLNNTNSVNSTSAGEESAGEAPAKMTSPSPNKSQRLSSSADKQVAMATRSGAVFIFSNFVVLPYTNLPYAVSSVTRFPAVGVDDLDAVLCCGHFNKLCILQNKRLVTSYETRDWVRSVDILDRGKPCDSSLLVIGCADGSVNILKIRKSR